MKHFDPSFTEDVADISSLAAASISKDGEIRGARASGAIDCLALARDGLRRIEERYKQLVEPVKLLLFPYDTERKELKTALEKVEAEAKDALLRELKAKHELPEESKSGTRLSIVTKPVATITDAAKIPNVFLLPREQCIDMVKLTDFLKAERKLREALVAAGHKPTMPMAGAELTDTFILSTRLPEVIV